MTKNPVPRKVRTPRQRGREAGKRLAEQIRANREHDAHRFDFRRLEK